MIFCASIVLPDSTRVLIWSFCDSVKLTPTFCSAVTPLIGSLRALPTWIDAADMSSPNATDMSVMIDVAWLKTSLPLPASLRTFVNVSSRFSPDWIASSSTPVLFEIDVASAPTCLAVTPATPPVVCNTLVVRAATFADSAAASYRRLEALDQPGAEQPRGGQLHPTGDPRPEVLALLCRPFSAALPTSRNAPEALSRAIRSKMSDRFANAQTPLRRMRRVNSVIASTTSFCTPGPSLPSGSSK
jgi:hypothetical protein